MNELKPTPYCKDCGSEDMAYVEQYADTTEYQCRVCNPPPGRVTAPTPPAMAEIERALDVLLDRAMNHGVTAERAELLTLIRALAQPRPCGDAAPEAVKVPDQLVSTVGPSDSRPRDIGFRDGFNACIDEVLRLNAATAAAHGETVMDEFVKALDALEEASDHVENTARYSDGAEHSLAQRNYAHARAIVESLHRAALEDAQRWRFYAEHGSDTIDGVRLHDWIERNSLLRGGRTKAIDAARSKP